MEKEGNRNKDEEDGANKRDNEGGEGEEKQKNRRIMI